MKECDFEYDEMIEFSETGWPDDWYERPFVGHIPEHPDPFISRRSSGSMVLLSWKYARRPRPKLKRGHPILVSDGDRSPHVLVFFSSWRKNKGVKSKHCISWDNYALLKNYDYNAPIDDDEGI